MAGRRGKNEGYIAKRADGRWEARIHLGWKDGKRQSKSFYGATRQEVKDALIKAQQQVAAEGLPEAGSITVAQYLQHWLEGQVKLNTKKRTQIFYEQYCRLYLVPNIGKHQLVKLTPQHLERMYSTLAKRLSPTTVHNAHITIEVALTHAVETGLLVKNVARILKAPKKSSFQGKFYSDEEAKRFVEYARQEPYYALYVLVITTGLRWAELTGLRWEDVDLEASVIRVATSIQQYSGKWWVEDPKSASSRRSVEIPTVAVEALKAHQEQQVKQRTRRNWKEHGLVFTSAVGTPMHHSNIRQRSYKPLLVKAGLPDIRFHDLRHSHASLLLALGIHPKVVQGRLGHSSINVTMDLYSHLAPNMGREASDKIQGLFEP